MNSRFEFGEQHAVPVELGDSQRALPPHDTPSRNIATRWRDIKRGVVEFEFDVPDSIHANDCSLVHTAAAAAATTKVGRADTGGVEVGAVVERRVDAVTPQRLGARSPLCSCGRADRTCLSA